MSTAMMLRAIPHTDEVSLLKPNLVIIIIIIIIIIISLFTVGGKIVNIHK